MAKFFVPAAEDSEQAERVYQAVKQHCEEVTGFKVGPRRIQSVVSRNQGTPQRHLRVGDEYTAEVGRPHPLTGETVLMILDCTPVLVCTENRGVVRGGPIMTDARGVTYFEE